MASCKATKSPRKNMDSDAVVLRDATRQKADKLEKLVWKVFFILFRNVAASSWFTEIAEEEDRQTEVQSQAP